MDCVGGDGGIGVGSGVIASVDIQIKSMILWDKDILALFIKTINDLCAVGEKVVGVLEL